MNYFLGSGRLPQSLETQLSEGKTLILIFTPITTLIAIRKRLADIIETNVQIGLVSDPTTIDHWKRVDKIIRIREGDADDDATYGESDVSILTDDVIAYMEGSL